MLLLLYSMLFYVYVASTDKLTDGCVKLLYVAVKLLYVACYFTLCYSMFT